MFGTLSFPMYWPYIRDIASPPRDDAIVTSSLHVHRDDGHVLPLASVAMAAP